MTRWVIYSTCSIVALCSMGAADLTVPIPPASTEDVLRMPATAEPTGGPGGDATTDASRRSTPA